MTNEDFEKLAIKALEELPEEFKGRLENVDVVIEEEPDLEALKRLGMGAKGRLLGLYQGVPLMNRSHYYGMVMPDKITLYKANIERACQVTGQDINSEISHVIQHEIAHHFGISDQRLRDTGTY